MGAACLVQPGGAVGACELRTVVGGAVVGGAVVGGAVVMGAGAGSDAAGGLAVGAIRAVVTAGATPSRRCGGDVGCALTLAGCPGAGVELAGVDEGALTAGAEPPESGSKAFGEIDAPSRAATSKAL